MTARQLERLAELSATAEDFYRKSDPSAARRFRDAAVTASVLAKELARAEEQSRLQLEVAELRQEVMGHTIALGK